MEIGKQNASCARARRTILCDISSSRNNFSATAMSYFLRRLMFLTDNTARVASEIKLVAQ